MRCETIMLKHTNEVRIITVLHHSLNDDISRTYADSHHAICTRVMEIEAAVIKYTRIDRLLTVCSIY